MSAPAELERRRLPEPPTVRVGRWRVLASARGAVVTTALLAGAIVVVLATLGSGPLPVSPAEVVDTILRRTDEFDFVVLDIGLPRACVALLVGAGLGVAGSLLQALTRNPLGSPDVIGFTTGSASGALIAIIVIGAGPAETAAGALLAGGVTAAVVYLLAWRRGLTGGRLVLVGIGIAAVLQGLNSLLLVRASLTSAQTAAQWLAGSFNATGWPRVLLLGAALVVLLPAAALLARPLGAMVLGDDLAAALGVRVERSRTLLVVVGVALVAVATATAGPIGFIALAAPQIARRLTRSSAVGFGSAAVVGAGLVLASDLVAQRLFAPTQLAVGVVTGVLGGGYLIWLLGSQWRKGAR